MSEIKRNQMAMAKSIEDSVKFCSKRKDHLFQQLIPSELLNESSVNNSAVFCKEDRLTIYIDGSHKHKMVQKKRSRLGSIFAGQITGHSVISANFSSCSKHLLTDAFVKEKQREILNGGVYKDTFKEKYGSSKEVIGAGSFGVVRISIKKNKTSNEKKFFAIKEFIIKEKEDSYSEYVDRATKEFAIGNLLNHVNIVKTYDLLIDERQQYFQVMKYCECGNLFTLLANEGSLGELEANCFMKQLMTGVEYMHDNGIAHRDLKPENLLITLEGIIKISDFGTAETYLNSRTETGENINKSTSVKGSYAYIPPEVYSNKSFDPRKHDIWSCGTIYVLLMFGRRLWSIARMQDTMYRNYVRCVVAGAKFQPFELVGDPFATPLLYRLLHPSARRRPTAHRILSDRWLASASCHEHKHKHKHKHKNKHKHKHKHKHKQSQE